MSKRNRGRRWARHGQPIERPRKPGLTEEARMPRGMKDQVGDRESGRSGRPGAAGSEPCVLMEFGGCFDTEEARREAMTRVHDNLIANAPVRLGPVEWRFFDRDAAPGMLADAGFELTDPRILGLLHYLSEASDRLLVVGSVVTPCPEGD